MSRGLGRVEKALADAFANAEPGQSFTTDDLCRIVYGGAEKKHRVAVLRALPRVLPADWQQMRPDELGLRINGNAYVWEREADTEERNRREAEAVKAARSRRMVETRRANALRRQRRGG